MIFGLLRDDIRLQVKQEDVNTFEELLSRTHALEETRSARKNESTGDKKPRPRCEFCRNMGHTITECRKKRAQTQPPQTETSGVRCYGCNAPGVFRKNCPTCNQTQNTATTSNMVGFCTFQTRRLRPRPRPAVTIQIAGTTGTAFIDTAAGSSVASAELFKHLQRTGHETVMETVEATFADGSTKTLKTPTIATKVELHGRWIPTTFIALSQDANTKTLLGADFIEDAGLIPDLASRSFFLETRPTTASLLRQRMASPR